MLKKIFLSIIFLFDTGSGVSETIDVYIFVTGLVKIDIYIYKLVIINITYYD